VADVQRKVCRTRFDHPEDGGDKVDRAGQGHAHDVAGPASASDEAAGDPVGACFESGVAQPVPAAHHGDGFGGLLGPVLEKAVQERGRERSPTGIPVARHGASLLKKSRKKGCRAELDKRPRAAIS
jgi:hypothetical protein